MNWTEQRSSFRSGADAVAGMLEDVSDFTIPGLGIWDLSGLAGHFVRAIRTPITYLQEPIPDGEPLPSAAAYVAGYLRWRGEDADAADDAVAARGADELSVDGPHPAHLIRLEAGRLDVMLAQENPARLVPTRFGPMRLDHYLRTRSMELIVHGLDIAKAVGHDWSPPSALLGDVLTLLMEVAIDLGSAEELLLVLSGRINPTDTDVLPVLR
ncbi:MAG: maleylpyruvate isomerase N-terminal domain-containing protein [Actinomycetota bacterium]|nr:maleylpyruvate isomerase N-terminal domain-containing protein [Actinomycetota bacterium]